MVDVSIVIPIYKVEAYLRQGLDSVLAQTHRSIEVILVDDASPDGCDAICDEYAQRDARVRVIHKPKNEGVGMARNTGMDAAQGEYLYFCDPDDWIEPTLVEETLALARQHHADVVAFGYWLHQEEGTTEDLPRLSGVYSRAEFWDHLAEAHWLKTSLCIRLFRRAFLVENQIRSGSLKVGEDACFLFDTYAAPFSSIVFQRKSYYHYVMRSGSAVTSYKPERFENQIKACSHFAEVVDREPLGGKRYQWLLNLYFVLQFLVAYRNMVHGEGLTNSRKLEILRKYAHHPANRAAIRGVRLKDAPTRKLLVRFLMLKMDCLALMLWADSRRPGVQ